MRKIEIIHEGEDYIKVEFGGISYEVSKSIGIMIEQMINTMWNLVEDNNYSKVK